MSTRAVVAGRPTPTPDAPLSEPVVAASVFAAGGERGYGRYSNPTWESFETAVGSLDGGRAVAFASGMAAVSAAVSVLLGPGSDPSAPVVVPTDGYHTSIDLLARTGRPQRAVPMSDTEGLCQACAGAALVWAEIPSNPLLEVPDLPAVVACAHAHGVPVVVDATAATPLLTRPLLDGADLVVHAATKYLSGHSDLLLGVVCAPDEARAEQVRTHRTRYGAVPGAFEAWLALRGLRTLPVRLERAGATAATLAHRLADHPAVRRVRYPGWGGLVAIEVDGDADAADRVAGSTHLWVHATSFGGVESTLERRRRWPAEREVVPESLLRLSVGLEDADDLWRDLDAALTRA
jgi:cystathionine gamma-synthase